MQEGRGEEERWQRVKGPLRWAEGRQWRKAVACLARGAGRSARLYLWKPEEGD